MCKKRTYNVLSAGFFAVFGMVIIGLAISFKEYGKHEISYLNQIAEDWDTTPFTSLSVTKDSMCPRG